MIVSAPVPVLTVKLFPKAAPAVVKLTAPVAADASNVVITASVAAFVVTLIALAPETLIVAAENLYSTR